MDILKIKSMFLRKIVSKVANKCIRKNMEHSTLTLKDLEVQTVTKGDVDYLRADIALSFEVRTDELEKLLKERFGL